MDTDLHCFLYHSCLTADADLGCVADIVKTARSFNKEADITGMLVFDGLRFFQYIEGPQLAIQALMDRIVKDSRHVHFTPKHRGSLVGPRLFGQWAMAYVLVDDCEPLDDLTRLDGRQALNQLQALIPVLDIA